MIVLILKSPGIPGWHVSNYHPVVRTIVAGHKVNTFSGKLGTISVHSAYFRLHIFNELCLTKGFFNALQPIFFPGLFKWKRVQTPPGVGQVKLFIE